MNKQDILAMEPGRELDALVAIEHLQAIIRLRINT